MPNPPIFVGGNQHFWGDQKFGRGKHFGGQKFLGGQHFLGVNIYEGSTFLGGKKGGEDLRVLASTDTEARTPLGVLHYSNLGLI